MLALQHTEKSIHIIRNEKVMLDSDLAKLYGVETKNLNKAVSRNKKRFPPDFMFQMTIQEVTPLRFQFGTSKEGRGGVRYLPYAFTEHGVAMLSSVLKSQRAIDINIEIMRAFVRMRKIVHAPKETHEKIAELEQVQKIHGHLLNEHNDNIAIIFDAIRKMEELPEETDEECRIGFLR